MQKYDLENLLHDIRTLVTSKLNTQIAAVEAEKIAQGLAATGLVAVDTTNGLFEQLWSIANLNINPAIFYGIEKVNTQGIGPASSQVVECFIEIILTDGGMDKLGVTRIHRYTRAIKDIFEDNYDRFPVTSNKIKIETVRPLSFKLESDSSEVIRVGGISLTMAIA